MSEIHHPGMELEATTYHCSHCGHDIALSNQLTHDVACARIHRNDTQRIRSAQNIVRQSSSSASQTDNQPRLQPVSEPEDRGIIENRLIACPNCGKSVREQEINSHMDNECLKNELIPCEFCDESIPMSDYGKHVEGCQRRAQGQNQQNNDNRDRSPHRERPNQTEEEPFAIPQEESPSERDRSPERGSSQGGIRGFLRNLAGSAANQLRNYNEQLHRQAEERQRQREEEQERQQEMLRYMFGQPQVPRSLSENQLVPYRSNGGSRVIRTIEQGPGGSIIVRSRVVPSSGPQMSQGMPNGPIQMGMDPMEMLLGMMSGRMGGTYALGNGEVMGQPEETGLDQETINSLALVKYTNEMNKNIDEESKKCPICLDQFEEGQEVRFLWCMHRFHKNCVDQWLNSHTNCPICKKDFSEAEQGFSP